MDFRYRPTPTLLAVDLSLLFSIFYVLPPASSQTGFLSFDCGSSASNYLDASTGFTWQTDGTYWPSIGNWSVPVTVTPPADMAYLKPLSTLRYFPNLKPSSSSSTSFDNIGQETKICYQLPAVKDSFYLLRATFWLGSNLPDGYPAPRTSGTVSFRVIVDTYLGVLVKLSLPQTSVWFEEMDVKAVGSTVTLCLSSASDSSDTPFLNALELRPLTSGMYATDMTSGLTASTSAPYPPALPCYGIQATSSTGCGFERRLRQRTRSLRTRTCRRAISMTVRLRRCCRHVTWPARC